MHGIFARFAPRCGLALAWLTAFGLLSACQAQPGAGGLAKAVDPCALVTRADAEHVLGAPVKPATRSKIMLMATGRECRYVTAAPIASAGGTWSIDLVVWDDASVAGAHSIFKNAADYYRRKIAALRSSGTTLIPVPGLGDSAWWQPGPDLLHILDHGVYISLDVDADFDIPSGSGEQTDSQLDTAKRAAEISLAQDTILPRLAHLPSVATHPSSPAGNAGHSS